MPAPSLSPWFLFGLLVAACGPEPPRPDDTQADFSTGQGGSRIVIATSDGPPSAGSTTVTPSGTNDRTAGSAAASGGAPPTTASTTGTASSGASGVDGAGGDRTSSDAAGGASVGPGGASSDAGGGEASGGGGGGQDARETATGGELVPPIAVGALLISEYLEGSSGSDKAIELSNMSSDVLALEACQLVIYFNGKSTPGNEVPLMGELLPGTSH